MKRFIYGCLICLMMVVCVGCGEKSATAIELMGAGDRIHDTYTFANNGVGIKDEGKNVYSITGSVEKLTDEKVRNEFKIAEDISHIVAIKLTAIDEDVVKDEVVIYTNGNEAYDAEHLNGSDYTFVLLEVVPGGSTSISVKWNKDAKEINYVINFSEDIKLK